MEELYRNDSSGNYLHNLKVPIVFINAKDDPLVHPELLSIPEAFVSKYSSFLAQLISKKTFAFSSCLTFVLNVHIAVRCSFSLPFVIFC